MKQERRVCQVLLAHRWAAFSLALLTAMVCSWPELFLFRKYLILPGWAKVLPAPGHAGVYLATAALVWVTWGTRSFRQAVGSTLVVCLAGAAAAVFSYALRQHWHTGLLLSSVFNYAFVLFARLTAPALALLALRWAVRTWIRL